MKIRGGVFFLFLVQVVLFVWSLEHFAYGAMLTYSFDDGHISVYDVAYPILQEYGQVGTANIVTNSILEHWPSKMTIDQLAELESNGWEITSHSKAHPHFSQIPLTYDDEILFTNWSKLPDKNFTYQSTDYTYKELKLVVENGEPLKRVYSVSRVEEVPGSFYFDATTKTLYVHTSNSDDPTNYEIRSDSVERELAMSKEDLINMGFDVNSFIVPYSDWHEGMPEIAAKYYDSVGAGYHDGYLNDIPPDNVYWLARRPVLNDITVDEVKSWIQEAIDEDKWLILMFHEIGDPPADDPWPEGWWSEENLKSLVSWVADQDILVVTQQQGVELASVPLPSSSLLVLAGTGLLSFVRRRLRKK